MLLCLVSVCFVHFIFAVDSLVILPSHNTTIPSVPLYVVFSTGRNRSEAIVGFFFLSLSLFLFLSVSFLLVSRFFFFCVLLRVLFWFYSSSSSTSSSRPND